jgi:hypothetical protein
MAFEPARHLTTAGGGATRFVGCKRLLLAQAIEEEEEDHPESRVDQDPGGKL